jgi:hypothetical protein
MEIVGVDLEKATDSDEHCTFCGNSAAQDFIDRLLTLLPLINGGVNR